MRASSAGSHDCRTAHWKRAAARVRRCEMPTTLRPSIEHLPRPDAGEADPTRPLGGHETAGVHHTLTQCITPCLTEPVRGPTDVVVPERVTSRDDHVDPQHLARSHEHRTTATPPVAHLEAGHVDVGLRAAEHKGGLGDVEDPDRARSTGSGTSRAWSSAADPPRRSTAHRAVTQRAACAPRGREPSARALARR